MKRIVSALALFPALAVVGTATAQNLLVNPGFDSDLSGWSIFPSSSYTVTWTPTKGANALGAAQIDVNAVAAQNTYVFQQCVTVSPSTNYDFGAHVKFPSGVAQIPTARLQVEWYTGGGCSGVDGSSPSSSTVNSPDTWQNVTATSRMSPSGATGAKVSTVFQTPAGGTSQLWFDDIYFGPSGSTNPTGTNTWVPVASHNPGKAHSQWRSDLGLLNPGAVVANVQIKFYGTGGVVSTTTYVPAKTQSILTDVVGQIGGANSGALQIISDQALKVTARSYNLVASDAGCYPNGTQGQDYPALLTSDGLSAPQSAYLGGLSESTAAYRCNIGLVNTGTGSATVLVELFDGAGTKLTDYTVTLNPGDWKQETQPFFNKAGQTAMDRGYAKVTVQTGSGVFAFASVVDGLTNDPTTVSMQR
ncbi:MAG: carbohydrate binding domain-containing protein [Acidobacteriia bacterium]|nr:carbohydrate binding domain-containing protein [Terriglobia bacterium]